MTCIYKPNTPKNSAAISRIGGMRSVFLEEFINFIRCCFPLAVFFQVVSNGRVALENLIKYGILISPVKWVSFMLEESSFWNWPNFALILFSNITILVVFVTEKILGELIDFLIAS